MSEQYISMCNCPDIQGQWVPKAGDHYVLGCKKDKTPAILILGCHWEECRGCQYEVTNWKDECVWLPRQDQLQEMAYNAKTLGTEVHLAKSAIGKHGAMFWWATHNMYYALQFKNSMEQLWLAYVMYEKYNKKWNGKEWVKGRRKMSKCILGTKDTRKPKEKVYCKDCKHLGYLDNSDYKWLNPPLCMRVRVDTWLELKPGDPAKINAHNDCKEFEAKDV